VHWGDNNVSYKRTVLGEQYKCDWHDAHSLPLRKAGSYSCASTHPRRHSLVSPSQGFPSVPASNPSAYSSEVVSTPGMSSAKSSRFGFSIMSALDAEIRYSRKADYSGSCSVKSQIEDASKYYLEMEKLHYGDPGMQLVQVSVNQARDLPRAYPTTI